MTTTITFEPGGTIRHASPTVYTRARWADAWVLDESLDVTDVAWACLPTMPAASLTLHYGRVRWFGEDAFATREKLRGMSRRYVKIVVPMQQDEDGAFVTKTWHGVFQLSVDEQQGATFEEVRDDEWESIATGSQQLTAYGMESLLNTNVIVESRIEFGGGADVAQAAVEFNRRGLGNRSSVKYSGAYAFADVLAGSPNWTSYDIAEYLLATATPRDSADAVKVTFSLASTAWLPGWDDPQIDPAEQTCLSVLQRVASRQRLLSAWFAVDDNTNAVELHTDTIVPAPINLNIPGAVSAVIEQNATQLLIVSDEDQATRLGVKDSDVPVYDVVVARGGPEISVGTFSFPDATLEANWTTTKQTQYEAGASGAAGFAGLTLKLQQKATASARSSPPYDAVFAYFHIPRTWDQRCKNGEGAGAATAMFPTPIGGAWPVYYPTMFVEGNLPLLAGADYADNAIAADGTGETADMKERLPLLVFLKSPEDSRWIRAEDIGNAADLEIETAAAYGSFTVHAHAPPESHGFILRVAGAPQHAIAYGNFSPLTQDPDAGRWSYNTGMVATLAIPSGRRVQGQWPPEAPAGKDAVRYYYLDVGDNMEAVYVVPGTVVGVKTDGTLQRSVGGWLYRPKNAVEYLTALAKIASAWYSIPHYVVTIETQRLTTLIGLGNLIARIGDPRGNNKHQLDTNAPVSEIRVSWPLSTGDEPEPPTMTVQTFAGELDPVQFQPSEAPMLKNIWSDKPSFLPAPAARE
jgi:hypothetical protein